MNKGTWLHWLLASILVLLAGAVLVVAAEERIEVKVENRGGDEVSVDVNGVVEVVRLEDLADGEERSFDVGDHALVVKRAGDKLTITSDGHGLGSAGGLGASLDTMVWVSDDGEKIEIGDDCDHKKIKKVIVMKSGEEGEGESKTYVIRLDGDDVLLDGEMDVEIDKIVDLDCEGHPHGVFISKDRHGAHPMLLKSGALGGDMVTYRCEESGAVLMLKKDDATAQSYICPATGCVMTKVDAPEMRVIKIQKKVDVDE